MVEISEIRDRESFEAWLNALPRETPEEKARAQEIAVTLAARAAARVLPLWWSYVLGNEGARKRGLTALPVLRSILISSVAAVCPTDDIKAASAASAAAARAAASAARAASARAAASAASAARAASAAAASAASAARAASARAAAYAASAARAAAYAAWDAIRTECERIVRGESVWSVPLWPQDNPFDKAWRGIKAEIARRDETEAWAFWFHWYDGLLTGTAPDPASEMMQEIALLPDEVWKDEAEALRRINAIWERYKVGDPADGFNSDLAVDQGLRKQGKPSPTIVQAVQSAVAKNREAIPDTLDGLQDLIAHEIERWQQNNFLNSEMPDLCREQIKTYLTMFEALERIRPLIPVEGVPTEEEAEQIVGLGKLYMDEFKSLPREKVKDVANAAWERGGTIVDLALVFGTTALLTKIGVPPQHGVVVGGLVFGGKKAAEIIKAGKEYVGGSHPPP